MSWKDIILHPVCLILRKDGSLEPAEIAGLNPRVFECFKQDYVIIGDPESYKWVFDKRT